MLMNYAFQCLQLPNIAFQSNTCWSNSVILLIRFPQAVLFLSLVSFSLLTLSTHLFISLPAIVFILKLFSVNLIVLFMIMINTLPSTLIFTRRHSCTYFLLLILFLIKSVPFLHCLSLISLVYPNFWIPHPPFIFHSCNSRITLLLLKWNFWMIVLFRANQ